MKSPARYFVLEKMSFTPFFIICIITAIYHIINRIELDLYFLYIYSYIDTVSLSNFFVNFYNNDNNYNTNIDKFINYSMKILFSNNPESDIDEAYQTFHKYLFLIKFIKINFEILFYYIYKILILMKNLLFLILIEILYNI